MPGPGTPACHPKSPRRCVPGLNRARTRPWTLTLTLDPGPRTPVLPSPSFLPVPALTCLAPSQPRPTPRKRLSGWLPSLPLTPPSLILITAPLTTQHWHGSSFSRPSSSTPAPCLVSTLHPCGLEAHNPVGLSSFLPASPVLLTSSPSAIRVTFFPSLSKGLPCQTRTRTKRSPAPQAHDAPTSTPSTLRNRSFCVFDRLPFI